MKARLRNYGLWVAVASFIVLVAQVFGWQLPSKYNELVNGLLGIFVLLGVLSNPTTNNNGFLDDLPAEPSKITNIKH